MVTWKKSFIERYGQLTDINAFIKASSRPMRKSIRVNTLKTTVKEIKKRFKQIKQIPWCKDGFFIKSYAIGNTLEHFLGYIYVQGAASMIPAVVLDAKPGEIVLDMCASPGSKTSQIAACMKNKGLIIANDIKIERLKPLRTNLQRSGVANVIITQMYGESFPKTGLMFDKVLVDAPCSGLGTIRKSSKTIVMYNPNMIKRFANTQKRLIEAGFNCLKQGGVMVYSTCTIEPEENEGVVSWLLDKYSNAKLETIKLNIKRSKPITEFYGKQYNNEVKKCLRILPQDNDTEGFFVAKIVKKD